MDDLPCARGPEQLESLLPAKVNLHTARRTEFTRPMNTTSGRCPGKSFGACVYLLRCAFQAKNPKPELMDIWLPS